MGRHRDTIGRSTAETGPGIGQCHHEATSADPERGVASAHD
jgi:hypothetical protein